MRIYCFVFLIIFTPKLVAAENLITRGTVDTTQYFFPFSIGVSFNSTNFHSGIRLSAEQILKIKQYKKYRADSVFKTKYRVNYLAGNFIANRDKDFSTGFTLGLDYGMQLIKQKGKIRELVAGVGVTKTFLTKAAFTVENNQVKQLPISGNLYGNIILMAGIGRDYAFTIKKLPIKWHIKMGVNILFPYGSFILPYFTMDAGIVYRVKWKLLKVKTNVAKTT